MADTTGGDAAATATATSTATMSLRRPKRDSMIKAEAVKTTGGAPDESASGATTRRSQRTVKSAYATPSTETVANDTPLVSDKKQAMTVEDASVASEVPARRTRPARGAAASATAVVASTPTEPVTPIASPLLTPTKKVGPLDVDGDETAPGLSTPTRNRRPSRRQLEGDEPTQRAQLLLGQFSANDATALCEVVWHQIKENSYRPDVLLQDRSPACIDWHRVAERLARSSEIVLTPRACQRLWKFLAYAQDAASERERDDDDALMADSDPEDYERTPDKMHAHVATPKLHAPVAGLTLILEASQTVPGSEPTSPPAASRTEPTLEQSTSGTAEAMQPHDASESAAEVSTTAGGIASDPVGSPDTLIPRETLRTAGIQLFPEYDQPSGVPDAWQKPFDLQRQIPLVFIAEKFLKRKVAAPRDPASGAATSMEVDPSILAAAAMNVTLTGEKAQSKPKKKRVSDAGGEEKKPKKPRKKKEPTAPSAVTPSAATGAIAVTPAAATSKSPVPIRQGYVPSLTAPPTPTPARSAIGFFVQLHKENSNLLEASGVDEKKEIPANASPSPSLAAMEPAQLETAFASAPANVRTACEQLANDDLRRFEREQLRRRLWEKARASLQNSPAPSPAAVSAPTPSPTMSIAVVPRPVAASSTDSTPAPTPAPSNAVGSGSSLGLLATSQILEAAPPAQIP